LRLGSFSRKIEFNDGNMVFLAFCCTQLISLKLFPMISFIFSHALTPIKFKFGRLATMETSGKTYSKSLQ
jgi:hypothetical protein